MFQLIGILGLFYWHVICTSPYRGRTLFFSLFLKAKGNQMDWSVIGIILSLAFIVILALRGWHIIVIAPLAVVVVSIFSNMNIMETHDRTLYERIRQLRREILPDLSGWFHVRQIHGRRAGGTLHRQRYSESDRKRESPAGDAGRFNRLHVSHLRGREPVRRHLHCYSDRAASLQGN